MRRPADRAHRDDAAAIGARDARRARLRGRPPARSAARQSRLVLHDDRGADGDATIEIGDVLIGHAEAAGRYRLADRLRLVRAVDAIQRRAQIHGARAERIVDAAGHVARQIGPPRQHLRGRRPARPFLLGGDAVGAAPAEAVAADADAVAQRLAVGRGRDKAAARRC